MDSDAELLDRWKAGDQKAGGALVERHFSPVCRFFRSKLGDDVQDIVQHTFLDCVRRREDLDPTLGFRSFLFAVARRRLIDELRRRGRRPDFDPSLGSIAELGISPSQEVAKQQQTQLLQQAMPRLPVDQQVTLELFYWEGLSGREIAAVLEVSEHTIRSRLARAKARLKDELRNLDVGKDLLRTTLEQLERGA